MIDKYNRPNLERILQLNEWSDSALEEFRIVMQRIPFEEIQEIKEALQIETDGLINSWLQLEMQFNKWVLPLIQKGNDVDTIISEVQSAMLDLQAMAVQLLINYSYEFAAHTGMDVAEKQILENFLRLNGLVGVWQLMNLMRVLFPRATSLLHLSPAMLQYRISNTRMRLHIDYAHYVDETSRLNSRES